MKFTVSHCIVCRAQLSCNYAPQSLQAAWLRYVFTQVVHCASSMHTIALMHIDISTFPGQGCNSCQVFVGIPNRAHFRHRYLGIGQILCTRE